MRSLWRLLLLLLATVLIDFAVTNRQPVSLGLWPLPDIVEVPLYLVVLGGLALGFVVGEFAAWVGARRWRQEARQGRRRIAALEGELAAARRERSVPPAPREAAAPERERLAR
jgi:uncharacterized integral membrane protein